MTDDLSYLHHLYMEGSVCLSCTCEHNMLAQHVSVGVNLKDYYIHWRLSLSQHNAQIFHMVNITLHLVNTLLLK